MPAIILPGRNTVNPAHPLSAGLVGAWTVAGKDAFPLTRGVGVLTGTNTAVSGTSRGIVHSFSSAYLQNTSQSAVTGPPMTLAAWVWTNRISGADQRILTVSTGTTANYVFGIRLTSSIVGVQHYDGSADAGENYSSIGLSGQWVHVVGVVASLSDRRVYVNATRGSAPYGGTQASPSGVDRVSVGYAPWGTEYFDGQIAYPMIWNRALGAEDVWLLYRDTERLVRTGRRVYFFPSAGGGGATGSFAVQEPSPDTASFAGDVIVQGSFSPQEGGVDSATFAGLVKVQGSFAVQEPSVDTSLFEGQVVTPGSVTLSAATVLNVTRTTATPRVTVTFS